MEKTILNYALITPARNEQEFIELTIRSMLQQTLLPIKWVIVSDGSTDRTDEIVAGYAAANKWIELVRMPDRKERDFGGKVACFNAGIASLNGLDYDLIGNLDADLSFERDMFEFLISKFEQNPKLGLAGAPFSEGSLTEGSRTYDFRFSNIEHVSGACQLFRRECFEAIGGYVPLKKGGIDVVAVLSARMKGWQTRTFPERICEHHRSMASAGTKPFARGFRIGVKDYSMGFHPLWQSFRAIYQMTRPPFVIKGLGLFVGYFWAALLGTDQSVPKEVIQFQRREQIQRLKQFVLRATPFNKPRGRLGASAIVRSGNRSAR
jgi:glycosyltransferase involved in cell wall biosynthesis